MNIRERSRHANRKVATSLMLLFSIFTASSMASPSPPVDDAFGGPKGIQTAAALNSAPLLLSTDPRAAGLMSVGKLRTGDGSYNCTASVIASSRAPSPARRALVLTAGHCVEESDDNAVIADRAANPAWSFTPAYFIDTQAKHVAFGIERVVYATMKDVDLAVLELKATYGQLAALGVQPLQLKPGEVTSGTPVDLAHVPVIGVPDEERFLRFSSCHAGTRRFLVEGTHPWRWSGAVPNDCEGVAGGTSGAPLLLQGSTNVVGVLNTTVTPDLLGCGSGRPCELNEDNLLVSHEGRSYAIPVDRIAQALRGDDTVDLTRLDDGHGVALARASSGWISQSTEVVQGERVPARWHLRIEEGFARVRYKTGPAIAIDCADITGYSGPLPAGDQPLLDLALPAQDGIYAACVIGGNTSGIWQSPKHATVRLRQIDDTAPTVTPVLDTRDQANEKLVRPRFAIWELTNLFVKYGPASEVDCRQPDGYRQDIRTRWYRVDNAQPWRFCAYGTDNAGNPGPPATFEFN